MEFARKQLEKYGWTDGKGLGKYENGISEALKPKLKRSVAGIGHDLASDFTEHWWTSLYDKAAGNVQVKEKHGKLKKIKTVDFDFKITNNTWKINKKKESDNQEEYKEYFVKTAVLTNEGLKTEKVKDLESDNEVEKKDVFKMTDEELFAACEGRTAHKGARHGLKALGKLARIERQEQKLLCESKYNGYSHAKKYEKLKPDDCHIVEDASLNNVIEPTKLKKKKKKKRCKSIEDNNMQENVTVNFLDESEQLMSFKKEIESDIILQNDQALSKKLKRKKKRYTSEESPEIVETRKKQK